MMCSGESVTAKMAAQRTSGRALDGWRQIFLAAVLLLLAWGMIYYYFGVLLPIRNKTALGAWDTGGYQSDLYPRWLGARELLLHHRNPYSREMTEEIERGFYGRPIDPAMRREVDPEAFAYPVCVTFLLAPLLPLRFEVAQPVFTAILLFVTVVSFPLWIRGLKLSLGWRGAVVGFAAMMSSYMVIEGLRLDQITLLVSFFLAASVAAIESGYSLAAGILLGLSLVKPQLSCLFIAFVLTWSLGHWKVRKKVPIGFAATSALLLVGSELILPGWFKLWREAIDDYLNWHRGSLLSTLLGPHVAPATMGILLLLCAVLFWRFRSGDAGSAGFNFAVVFAFAATSLVLPNAGGGSFYNQILLLPAVLWLCTSGRALTSDYMPARVTWFFAAGTLAAEWILAFAVSFSSFILHRHFHFEATPFVGSPELLMYAFPAALALFVLCAAPPALASS
jgi:hypothetical protein